MRAMCGRSNLEWFAKPRRRQHHDLGDAERRFLTIGPRELARTFVGMELPATGTAETDQRRGYHLRHVAEIRGERQRRRIADKVATGSDEGFGDRRGDLSVGP